MKKTTIKTLQKKLDAVFSIYIRSKDADQNGNVKCYTCSKIDHWKYMHCGHFISRRHLSTRWDEKNCKPQCPACNLYNQGNAPVFAIRLIEDYGSGILNLLQAKKFNPCKMKFFEYEILIKEFELKP